MKLYDEAGLSADGPRSFSTKSLSEFGSTSGTDSIAGDAGTTASLTPRDGQISTEGGWINTAGDTDWFRMPVVAGTRYTIILTGDTLAPGGAALQTPTLRVYDAAGQLIATDVSLNGSSASYQLTSTVTGHVFVSAAGTNGTTGRYVAAVLTSAAPAPDQVPGDASTTATLAVGGSVDGSIEAGGDTDWFRVTLEAGVIYEFSQTALNDTLDPLLQLRDANGMVVAENDDSGDSLDSRITFQPTTSGTYYLAAGDFSQGTGRYSLSAAVGATNDIRTTLDWGSRVAGDSIINVYFVPGGQTRDGRMSEAWNDYEIGRAMTAFAAYAAVTGLSFVRTEDPGQAELRLVVTNSLGEGELGYFFAPGEDMAGLGVFSRTGDGWDEAGGGGLEFGGLGYATLVHEIGHGLGLAHPHDTGGTSTVMTGVNGPYDSFGLFDLNQGVFTTLGYNDGWRTGPTGAPPNNTFGLQGAPMALDIAVLQAKYGANTGHRTGDDVYVLPSANGLGTGYLAVWDAGGRDTFEHRGGEGAVIDLRSATIDYSPTGGGVVSYVRGVHGGFTVAAGVVIENALGGSGADVLRGNGAGNYLGGGAGADTLNGDAGNDHLDGGAGDDRSFGEDGNDLMGGQDGRDYLNGGSGRDELYGDAGGDHLDGGADDDRQFGGDGDDLIGGQDGRDYLAGGSGRDELYGDAGDDLLEGQADDDRQFGGDGADVLGGQDGRDYLNGGLGRDELYGDAGGDHLDGGADDDRQFGGDGDDLIGGQDGRDYLNGGSGRDELYGDAGEDLLEGQGDDDRQFGGDGADVLGGQDGNDYLAGGSGADALYGDGGNDLLEGQADDDRQFGGDGDDVLGGQDGRDYLNGGSGRDALYGDAGGDHLDGGADDDRQFGGDGDDLIGGQDGADYLDGGQGGDALYGDAGDDRLFGGAGNDSLFGGDGFDTAVFAGPASAYAVTVQDGITIVVGPDGTDRLVGVERLQFDDAALGAPIADAWVV